MKAIGIIPARFQSTRLPGKPLVPIAGKSLIQRVYENVSQCHRLDELIVATDDERIMKEVRSFGGKAVMTPSALASGTDRCAFVAKSLDADIIVNIQGDEPFLDIRLLDWAIKLLTDVPDINIVTAAKVGISTDELNNPNVVKVLVDKNQNALYFSRQNIPYIRNHEALTVHPAMQHIGIYVFRQHYLQKFVELPQTLLEQLEQLEQLRILENGEKIRVVLTDKISLGIDTMDDVNHAERILKSNEA
ncbi:MAG: 3-deoxy-manno-octulosonate cytidylyltransferase [Candidatus Marinimicrobia bacterium]|nr:3-deoxy-manno-octulosonate cytidylyltransferase [Candidatus Neomarinimicrobiota bacterium]